MYAILLRRLLKPASVLGRLGAGCEGWISSVGLARLVPAVAFGRVEAGWDDGISSSESERFFCEHGKKNGIEISDFPLVYFWLRVISNRYKEH